VRVLVAPNVYRTRVLDLALPARQEVHTPIRITGLVQDLRGLTLEAARIRGRRLLLPHPA
jgi:hypothetical protein